MHPAAGARKGVVLITVANRTGGGVDQRPGAVSFRNQLLGVGHVGTEALPNQVHGIL